MTDNKNNNSFGLWKKTSKNGLAYLGGAIEIDGKEYWMNVFKNTNKQKDTHPDWNLLLTPKDPAPVEEESDGLEEVDF